MAVKKLRLDGIGNYAEDVIEQVVDFGAVNLLGKLKGQKRFKGFKRPTED